MKIFLVTENLGSGGAERQLTQLARLFKEAGHDPIVVTWENVNFFGEFLRTHSVKHILLRPHNKFDRVRKMSALMRQLKPDAVISYLPMANETVTLARLLCLGVRMRLIVSERSFTVDWGMRRRLTNLLYRLADYVVANSNNEAENIRRHCPQLTKRTVAIPNMVDFKSFIEANPRSYQSPLQLVGVGRIISSKNIERLIRALAEVRHRGYDFHIKWFGSHYDSKCVESVKRAINEYDLADCFELKEASNNIAQVYAEADAFVFPSLLEGYPNVLVEAMASGLPIAVSAVCEHPHIVRDGENGFLFDPTDVASIADAICKLCSLSPGAANEMGARNRTYAVVHNSPQIFLKHYLDLCE